MYQSVSLHHAPDYVSRNVARATTLIDRNKQQHLYIEIDSCTRRTGFYSDLFRRRSYYKTESVSMQKIRNTRIRFALQYNMNLDCRHFYLIYFLIFLLVHEVHVCLGETT